MTLRSLRLGAAEYLRLRSSLGRSVNADERYFLERFLAFYAKRQRTGPITSQLVLEWLRSNAPRWGVGWQRPASASFVASSSTFR